MDTFEQATTDTQDYDINFNRYLTGLSDTGVSSVVTVDPGITLISSVLTAGVIKLWVTGGVDGQEYLISIKLTTTGGRTKTKVVQFKIKDK
jgi:hypothetical protein